MRPTDEERFLRSIRKTDGCWLWTASTRRGYGQLMWRGKMSRAPRVAYEHFIGPFDKALDVCHACDNPTCVNPAHLWLGTAKDNARDMVQKGRDGAWNRGKAQCVRGHALEGVNLYIDPAGKRLCRTCQRDRDRAYKQRKRSNNRFAAGT